VRTLTGKSWIENAPPPFGPPRPIADLMSEHKDTLRRLKVQKKISVRVPEGARAHVDKWVITVMP